MSQQRTAHQVKAPTLEPEMRYGPQTQTSGSHETSLCARGGFITTRLFSLISLCKKSQWMNSTCFKRLLCYFKLGMMILTWTLMLLVHPQDPKLLTASFLFGGINFMAHFSQTEPQEKKGELKGMMGTLICFFAVDWVSESQSETWAVAVTSFSQRLIKTSGDVWVRRDEFIH